MNPDTDALRFAADGIGVRTDDGDTWEDIFFRIFLERIEPGLGVEVPTVLRSYPASMAALARLSPDDQRVSDRFEIFICGLELANGYGELTDADEQRARFAVMTEQQIAAWPGTRRSTRIFLQRLKRVFPIAPESPLVSTALSCWRRGQKT